MTAAGGVARGGIAQGGIAKGGIARGSFVPDPNLLLFTSALDSRLTFTRNTARLSRNASRTWTQAATDAPRIHHDELGLCLGMLFEEGHSGKNRAKQNPSSITANINPGGSTTVTVDTTAAIIEELAGVGLDGLITSVWKVDNSAGGGAKSFQVFFTTGNTNAHSFSFFGRQSGSGDECYCQLNGMSATNTELSITDGWQQKILENITPSNNTRVLQFTIPDGMTFWLAQCDLIERPYFSTPVLIASDGSTVSPGPDSAVADLEDIPAWNTTSASVAVEFYHPTAFYKNSQYIFSLVVDGDEANEHIAIEGRSDGTIQAVVTTGGSAVATINLGAPVVGAMNRIVFRAKTNSFNAALNGAVGTVDTSCTMPAVDKLYINRLASSYGNTIMRSVEVADSDLTDAQIQAASIVGSVGLIGSPNVSGLGVDYTGVKYVTGSGFNRTVLALSGNLTLATPPSGSETKRITLYQGETGPSDQQGRFVFEPSTAPDPADEWVERGFISPTLVVANPDTAPDTLTGGGSEYDYNAFGKYWLIASGSIPANVAHNWKQQRYDLLQMDALGAVTVVQGRNVDMHAGEFLPELGSGKTALHYAFIYNDTITLVDAWKFQNGIPLLDRAYHDEIIRRNKSALSAFHAKLAAGQSVTIAGYGDSITAVGAPWSDDAAGLLLATQPNGSRRDILEFYPYLTPEVEAQIPVYDTGDGANHIRDGWMWSVKRMIEGLSITCNYHNWGIGGTTSISTASLGGGSWSTRLNAIVNDAPDLVVVAFGMNEPVRLGTYADMKVIVEALQAAGSAVAVMGCVRPQYSEQRMTNAQLADLNERLRRVAYDTGAAWIPTDIVSDDDHLGYMGLAANSLCGSNLFNHPNPYEYARYGQWLAEACGL